MTNLSYQHEGNSQMTKTLEELLASRSQESQARIQEMADDLLLETQSHRKREERKISQKELQ